MILIDNGDRWLVAPYGEVGWVRNARAADEVEISRSGRSQAMQIVEVEPEQAAPVKRYLKRVPVVRPFFDVKPGSPIEELISEAPRARRQGGSVIPNVTRGARTIGVLLPGGGGQA